jgi:hypothetical protein
MDEPDYSTWTYEDLLSKISSLGELILQYDDMTPEQEAEFKRGSAEAGVVLSEDFREDSVVMDGRSQARIVRECLRRVNVVKLAEDSGLDGNALLLLAAHGGRDHPVG